MSACDHCGQPIETSPIEDKDGHQFCCTGCELVFQILSTNNLTEFYTLRDGASVPVSSQSTTVRNPYSYLDDLPLDSGHTDRTMGFYSEGMHCAACVWLLEQLPTLVEGVKSVRVQLGQSLAWVTLHESGSFSQAAFMMAQLGYPPHPLQDPKTVAIQIEHQRTQLIRLGVAGFCAANIMLFSVGVYAGVTDPFKTAFYWIMLGLLIPTVLFAAKPFFTQALNALKQKRFDMDIPVSFALIMGSVASVISLFRGSDHVYFDSVSMFIFLLLISRHFYQRAYLKADTDLEIFSALVPTTATKLHQKSQPTLVPTNSLKSGDFICVPSGETLPVDGDLQSESGLLETQLLTGEAAPIQSRKGETVFAGTRNCGPDIQVLVTAVGERTRLKEIFHQAKTIRKPQIVHLADRLAQGLLSITICLGIGLWGYQWSTGDFWHGFNQAMALIILACPCALALATPLTVTLANKQAIKRGLLLRQSDCFERLQHITTCFLDKTGTLTQGNYTVTSWTGTCTSADYNAIYAIESQSKHPVATALIHYLDKTQTIQPVTPTQLSETIGKGIQATVDGQHYDLKSAPSTTGKEQDPATRISIYRNDKLISEIALSDTLWPETEAVIQSLKALHITPQILSGDRQAVVDYWAHRLDISDAHGQLSPEDKGRIVQNTPTCLMIGDGANDALALSGATVSVAIQGCLESSLAVSDVYFLKPGLSGLPDLFDLSRGTWRALKTTLFLSLAYNTLGILAIFTLDVSPIIAAIIMPLSSFTVFISAYGLTGERILWKS